MRDCPRQGDSAGDREDVSGTDVIDGCGAPSTIRTGRAIHSTREGVPKCVVAPGEYPAQEFGHTYMLGVGPYST